MRALAELVAQSGKPGSCSKSMGGGGGGACWMLRWMRIEKGSCLILTDGSSRLMEPGQLANRMLLLALRLPTPLHFSGSGALWFH